MRAKYYKYDGVPMLLLDISRKTGKSIPYLYDIIYKYGDDKDIKKLMDFIAEPLYYYAVYDMRDHERCVCFGTLEQCADFLNIRPSSIHEIKCRNGGNAETNHGRLCGREGYEVHMFNKYDLVDDEELK